MKLYAVCRTDLQMPPGKLASQAGHAYLMSFLQADAPRQTHYHQSGLGTKICLRCDSLTELASLKKLALSFNLPHFLVEDTGMNTTFGGVPTISALGVGPLYPDECQLLQHLPLFK